MVKSLHRLAIATFAMSALLYTSTCGAPPINAGNSYDARRSLTFFEYAGASSGEARTYYERFKGILRDKSATLLEELQVSSEALNYLHELKIKPPGSGGIADNFETEQDALDYWKASHSLIMFRGIISPDSKETFIAQSRLYLGELKGSLKNPSISVRLPIRCDEFPNTGDSHSLLIYYALAQDAIYEGRDRSVIVELLSHAQEKIRDLKARGAMSLPLNDIEQAILAELTIQKSRGASQ